MVTTLAPKTGRLPLTAAGDRAASGRAGQNKACMIRPFPSPQKRKDKREERQRGYTLLLWGEVHPLPSGDPPPHYQDGEDGLQGVPILSLPNTQSFAPSLPQLLVLTLGPGPRPQPHPRHASHQGKGKLRDPHRGTCRNS